MLQKALHPGKVKNYKPSSIWASRKNMCSLDPKMNMNEFIYIIIITHIIRGYPYSRLGIEPPPSLPLTSSVATYFLWLESKKISLNTSLKFFSYLTETSYNKNSDKLCIIIIYEKYRTYWKQEKW